MKKEFTKLLKENQGIIHKVCNVYFYNNLEKEDYIQEIILELWKAFPNFKGQSKFSTWIYRVALNTAIVMKGNWNRNFAVLTSSNQDDILFSDYKLFVKYTRDSIMRKLLSTQLKDFSNFSATRSNDKATSLNWRIPINLNDEEILEILTNMSEYGNYYNFLIKENRKFYVIAEFLNYCTNDGTEVNIFPDFTKLDTNIKSRIDHGFNLDKGWNGALDDYIINDLLTQKQIIAFNYWKATIGLDKARRLTTRKIIM